jgi:hypothetical protein
MFHTLVVVANTIIRRSISKSMFHSERYFKLPLQAIIQLIKLYREPDSL